MPDWLPTEDSPRIDGDVECIAVRDDSGRDGIRYTLRDLVSLTAFEAFYDRLQTERSVYILDRGPGWVVFDDANEPPDDIQRFAVRAVDAVESVRPLLTGLTAESIGQRDGNVHLRPLWRKNGGPPPLRAVGDHLRRLETARQPQLHEAIDALVDPVPEVRRSARSLLTGTESHVASSNAAVKYTVAAVDRPARAQVDTARPRGAVVISAAGLAELTPSQKSAAAGLAGLSLQALDGLQAAGLPLVVETHRRPTTAVQRAQQVRTRTGLPVEAATGGGVMRPLFTIGLIVTSIATALGALSFALLGLVLLPLFGTLLTTGMLALAAWMGWAWNQDRNLLVIAAQSESEAEEERRRQGRDPELARAWNALSEARSGLAASDHMPGAAASDLRDLLKAAERELQQLATAQEVVRKGLNASSTETIRSRIATLDATDPSHAKRRESLQRTLAELEGLETRAERIAEDAHTLEAVLTEVAGSIARWETDPADGAMNAVLAATQSARRRHRSVDLS